MTDTTFTPALGKASLNHEYDRTIRFWTREAHWRSLLLAQVAPRAGEAILDVGCGTGTLAILLKQAAPGARIVGVDPDPAILAIARQKADAAGVAIEWREGFARDAAAVTGGGFDKAVSSLVFHQVPVPEKRAGVAAMFAAVRGGGEVHVADYARQRSWLMRQLFRIIQRVDGHTNTQPNADGLLETILGDAAGGGVHPIAVVKTPTGAISLFKCRVSRSTAVRTGN